jgi:hypothetical protein
VVGQMVSVGEFPKVLVIGNQNPQIRPREGENVDTASLRKGFSHRENILACVAEVIDHRHPWDSSTMNFIYDTGVRGKISSHAMTSAAYDNAARMSSGCRRGYSLSMSVSETPCAIIRTRSSTGMRVPRMTGLPVMTAGSIAILSSDLLILFSLQPSRNVSSITGTKCPDERSVETVMSSAGTGFDDAA